MVSPTTGSRPSSILRWVFPVSYTHLDVYKRQILGCIGLYQPFVEWAGAGASVPLLGFGNALWKGVMEGVGKDGLLGVFKGGFTAGSAGICGALVFGYLASLVFKPKMK